MNLKIVKIFSYDIETSPSFGDAKFITREELEKQEHKRKLKERFLKIKKLKNNVL